MKQPDGLVVIRAPSSPGEYVRACALTSERYRQAGYVGAGTALSQARALLIAVRGAEVIGSLGVESADAAPLPTERAFGFRADQVFGLSRAVIFEGTRFAVARGAASVAGKALVAGALLYASQRHDCRIWLCTIRRPQELFMRQRYHLRVARMPYPVADASLPLNYPAYWAADPPPHPISVDRASIDQALARLLPELEGQVRFELGGFDHASAGSRRRSGSTRSGLPRAVRRDHPRHRNG